MTGGPQAGDDVRKLWKDVRVALERIDALKKDLSTANQKIADLTRNNRRVGGENFPFRIYNLPNVFRTFAQVEDPASTNTAWRTFRVRAGRVGQLLLVGDGCDRYDENPDSDFYPTTYLVGSVNTAVKDVVVPNNTAKYWFWVEISDTGTTATLKHAAQSGTTVPGWASFPLIDFVRIPIGYVDTLTNNATRQPIVRQLLRADILDDLYMRFRGEYSAGAKNVKAGDTYRVTGGISAGTYVAVVANPTDAPSSGSPSWVMVAPGNVTGYWV